MNGLRLQTKMCYFLSQKLRHKQQVSFSHLRVFRVAQIQVDWWWWLSWGCGQLQSRDFATVDVTTLKMFQQFHTNMVKGKKTWAWGAEVQLTSYKKNQTKWVYTMYIDVQHTLLTTISTFFLISPPLPQFPRLEKKLQRDSRNLHLCTKASSSASSPLTHSCRHYH